MSRPTLAINDRFDWRRLRVLKWIVPGLLLLAIVFTASYSVPTDSVGVVLRFGKYSSTEEPGLHFKIPLGVDEVEIVAVERQYKVEFGFETPGNTNPYQHGLRSELDTVRNMVTGDTNAVLVEWVVQYTISDPRDYLFKVRAPEQTLRDLCEAVMREIIGDRTVDEVLTIGRQEIEASAQARLREMCKSYELGLQIEQLQLKGVNPPEQVKRSFNEVNLAQQDREKMINQANGEYNKVVPRARGEAEQLISEAEGYKAKRVNEALGDATAFTSVLTEYLKAPEVTRKRLYLETMKDVLPVLGDTWIVDDSVTQLLPMVRGAGIGGGK